MDNIIEFYKEYGVMVDNVLIYFRIIIASLLGTEAYNRFRKKNERKIKGTDRLVASAFMSMLIFYGLRWTEKPGVLILTSAMLGFSGDKFIMSLKENKIWEKFDFTQKKD